tara:strand:- start:593 stop:1108 length:516 start_codon:yes stop_codon:yes gene_type:complete
MMNLSEFISNNEIPFSQDEFQGFLVGLLACNLEDNFKDELKLFIGATIYSDHNSQKNIEDYIALLLKGLISKDICLTFDQNIELSEKVTGIADWTKYFSMSINLAVDKKYLRNSVELQELLFDLIEIGKLSEKYKLTQDSDDQENFRIIREFVLNSVYSIYNLTRESDEKK